MPRPTPGCDLPPEAMALAQRVAAWRAHTGKAMPTWAQVCEMLRDLGWTPPPAKPECRGQEGGGLD